MLVFVSCRGGHEQFASHEDVNVDVMLPMTPIKNQGHTPLCWIYTMLATIETDCLVNGDSVNLSPMWLARKSLEEQAQQSYFVGCNISMRGTLMEAMRLYKDYGIVAYDAAPPKQELNTSPLCREVARLSKTMAAQHKGTEALNDAVAGILDDAIGPMPRYVFMLGMEYTPEEFARSCAMPDDWQPYTSFTHHPYGRPFCIELKDNRQRHLVNNIPLDSLYNKVVQSLRRNHPVAWEGSLSLCSKLKSERVKELRADACADQRQHAFESFRLTDDHCMAIIGLGHRKDGTPVFIMKNSWGTNNGGLYYMSRDEFLMRTMLVMVKKV